MNFKAKDLSKVGEIGENHNLSDSSCSDNDDDFASNSKKKSLAAKTLALSIPNL